MSPLPASLQEIRRLPNVRWSWNDLTFSLSDRKLVVARRNRPELAHFTMGWGHRSGQVDFHLTFGHEAAMAGEQAKDHKPLFVLTPEMGRLVGEAGERFTHAELRPFLLKHYRRYRSGWLARNGYVVLLAGHDQFRELIERVAPKSGRKHRVDLRAFVSPETHTTVFRESVYSAEVLSCPEFVAEIVGQGEVELPVTAVRMPGGSPRHWDSIMLRYGPDMRGIVGWRGIMNRHVATYFNPMCWMMYEWLVPCVGPAHAAVFERIVEGMALDEVEDMRPALESIRRFMREPKNPAPTPPKGWLLRNGMTTSV